MAFSLVFYCSLFKLYIITHIIFVNLFNNFHTFIIKFVYIIGYVDSIYDELTLTVYKENSRAVNFYKSIGFNILDEQINDDTGSIEYYMKK